LVFYECAEGEYCFANQFRAGDSQSYGRVFGFTKRFVDETDTKHAFEKANIKAEAIHGDKSQNARQRVLEQFKNKEIDLLVATDIAARGIDIEQLPFVINFDIPNISETYVHRIGRTGRAGNSGLAISFCGKDEKTYWQDIEKLIRMKIKVVSDHPFGWKEEATNPNAKPLSIATAEKFGYRVRNDKEVSMKPADMDYKGYTKEYWDKMGFTN
jgi:ATP-dependent RNA helicase RhlE